MRGARLRSRMPHDALARTGVSAKEVAVRLIAALVITIIITWFITEGI